MDALPDDFTLMPNDSAEIRRFVSFFALAKAGMTGPDLFPWTQSVGQDSTDTASRSPVAGVETWATRYGDSPFSAAR